MAWHDSNHAGVEHKGSLSTDADNKPLGSRSPQPRCQLSISLPGQRERDRCQLVFVCFNPFPCRQNRAAALSCHTTGFIRRGLRYAGYTEDEEGSMRRALRGRWLAPEQRAALPTQIQPGSTLLVRERGYL